MGLLKKEQEKHLRRRIFSASGNMHLICFLKKREKLMGIKVRGSGGTQSMGTSSVSQVSSFYLFYFAYFFIYFSYQPSSDSLKVEIKHV